MTELHANGRPISGRQQFERDIVALRPKLLGFAWSLARNTEQAEDLVQDTYIKALSSWESFSAVAEASADVWAGNQSICMADDYHAQQLLL